MTYYALYNPLSSNSECEINSQKLKELLPNDIINFQSLLDIVDLDKYIQSIPSEDKVIICGGDGTLNRFVNSVNVENIQTEILYFPTGTGNDFAFDLGYKKECFPFVINEYLVNLPHVVINGKDYKFINGIGYGIDGYCCEEGDKQRLKGVKEINYTSIAINGLLFHYKPTGATVTVDGVKHEYKDVWLAPTMNGRYYGGGMMPTPNQKRNSNKLSVMIYKGKGRLGILMNFPNIFKGKHVENKKMVEVFEGKEIIVEFDRPTPLQIDGETLLGITSYKATV